MLGRTHAQFAAPAEIRALLLNLIDTLPEGAALPPERELSARWNVARMTLRRAVDELVIEELLIRRHGSGTYTARPKVAKWLGMIGFTEDIRRRERVFEYTSAVYRGDRYAFTAELRMTPTVRADAKGL